ncbi:MAG: alpha-mannosidase [Cyanobacteria bacterium J06638_20]
MVQSTGVEEHGAVGQNADLERAIARLQQLTQCDIQGHWRGHFGELPTEVATHPDIWESWQEIPLNPRHHIAWDKGEHILWLGQHLIIPADLVGYPLEDLTLRLAMTWWAVSAEIFVDGVRVQEGDLFDCRARILLRKAVQPGEAIALAIRLVSPGHDDGALVASTCLYEIPDYATQPCPEPGFIADELAVLQTYCQQLAPEHLPELAAAVEALDWSRVGDRNQFDAELVALRDRLLPFSPWIKQRQISLLGHAHLDLAWLWPVSETWEVAQRTFTSVLQLQAEFPELIFTHSTPALYAWIEEHRPDLFTAIQQQVDAGRWEVAAGLWVEPELNIISAESVVRQVLYGQHYVQERFGKVSAIAWLPDSFGFCWQLPQILQNGSIRYFVTQKLLWNDTNPFPHSWFRWQSPCTEASALHSLHSAPIGEEVDPLKMAHYAAQWESQTGHSEALWLIGVGDHGGGPSRDMLHLARRWQQSPFFPNIAFSTAEAFLDRLQANPSPKPVPTWTDELYLELHRGCYTTHADQKAWNHYCETALYEAELWSAIATQLNPTHPYPQKLLETAWKTALFNQFHDILPGSAIPEVFEDANPEWQAAAAIADNLRIEAMGAIAQSIQLSVPPIPNARPLIVFNALNWERSEWVHTTISSAPTEQWQVLDEAGNPLPIHTASQLDDMATCRLSFWAEAVPSVGYLTFWLCPTDRTTSASNTPSDYVLENAALRVEIDPATGYVAQIFDKHHQRRVLAGLGNELQLFQDQGQYWDAWDIAPDYEAHQLPAPELQSIEPLPTTILGNTIRVTWKTERSTIVQTYRLQGDTPMLHIDSDIDWHEDHRLLKVAFPLAITSDQVIRAMPAGAIAHPTRPSSPEEHAKWEVPALGWADLSDTDYGVSLLTTHKYGVDVTPNQLRLSLLRSPRYPNPYADRGNHQFSYALYPHAGSWQTARTVHHAAAFRQPIQAIALSTPTSDQQQPKSLPLGKSFLKLASENLILMAAKHAEAQPDTFVLRYYEAYGQSTTFACSDVEWLGAPLSCLQSTDLLEVPLNSPQEKQGESRAIAPWQISTFTFNPSLP